MKWFRMYASLVDSIKVGPLPHGSFRAYVELLCLACEKEAGGRTGVNKESISWRLRRDAACDVTPLVTAGLVTIARDGEYVVVDWDSRQKRSDTSAERTRAYRDRKSIANKDKSDGDGHCDVTCDGSDETCDGAEKSRGEEKDKTSTAPAVPAESPPPCPFDDLVAAYHEALPTAPQVLELNEARRGALRARWRERWDSLRRKGRPHSSEDLVAWFRRFFAHVAKSEFLTGKTQPAPGRRPFVADLDWLMGPKNHLKVVEGKYHEGGE